MKRIVLLTLSVACLSAFAAGVAAAQNWPTKPVKVIVGYAPGGSTDNATRPFLEKLSVVFGQQFVIENRSGASGMIGAETVAKAAPDGYTLLSTPVSALTIVPAARKTPYDPFKDFVPVALHADSTFVFAVHPSIPANTIQEFVAYAKQNPGKLAWGSSGVATITQMIGALLNKVAGIDMLHVPYRGGAESLSDFLAGNVQAFTEGNALPHIRAGKAKLLAVIDSERHPEFPTVPMMSEIYPEYDILNWFAIFAPAKTPDAIVRRLNEEINKIAKLPEMREQFQKIALKPRVSTPEQLAERLQKDYDRYAKLAKEINLKLE